MTKQWTIAYAWNVAFQITHIKFLLKIALDKVKWLGFILTFFFYNDLFILTLTSERQEII